MEKENFYITLPSSASLKEFPENTKANFKTRLYKTLKFNVPYEVALTEIIFPTINNHNYNLGKVTIRRQNIAELVEKYEKKLNLKREYSVNVETNNIDPESVATTILIIVPPF